MEVALIVVACIYVYIYLSNVNVEFKVTPNRLYCSYYFFFICTPLYFSLYSYMCFLYHFTVIIIIVYIAHIICGAGSVYLSQYRPFFAVVVQLAGDIS